MAATTSLRYVLPEL